ncbi:MAG: DUF4097 family beta strand repeat-containing protein [Oscillospiraceae bacterium]
MLKSCLKLLTTGLVFIVIGIVGLAVLGFNGLLEQPIKLSINQSSSDTSVMDSVSIPLDYSTDDINKLDITVSIGEFTVKKGEGFSISAEYIKPESLNIEVTDGCLTIDYSPEFSLINFDFSNIGNDSEITITVPENVYESIDFSVHAGNLNVENVASNRFILDFTAGDAQFENVSALQSAQIKMTAGECYFINSKFNNANIKMTAGDMNFDVCRLSGDNSIDMTAGELNMTLVGKRSDYKINIDKTAGEVNIDGMSEKYGYAVTTLTETAYTEVLITDTDVGYLVIDDMNGTAALSEDTQENAAENSGSIDIKITAGECNIDFIEEEYDYE